MTQLKLWWKSDAPGWLLIGMFIGVVVQSVALLASYTCK
jgi:hypothetical protein